MTHLITPTNNGNVTGNDYDVLYSRVERLEAALRKVRAYNVDIAAGLINYRPEDHIAVIDAALTK